VTVKHQSQISPQPVKQNLEVKNKHKNSFNHW